MGAASLTVTHGTRVCATPALGKSVVARVGGRASPSHAKAARELRPVHPDTQTHGGTQRHST